MLTQQSINGSHQLNQSYGSVRRGELDHQESAFIGPAEPGFVVESSPPSGDEARTPIPEGSVVFAIELVVSKAGTRRFRIG